MIGNNLVICGETLQHRTWDEIYQTNKHDMFDDVPGEPGNRCTHIPSIVSTLTSHLSFTTCSVAGHDDKVWLCWCLNNRHEASSDRRPKRHHCIVFESPIPRFSLCGIHMCRGLHMCTISYWRQLIWSTRGLKTPLSLLLPSSVKIFTYVPLAFLVMNSHTLKHNLFVARG